MLTASWRTRWRCLLLLGLLGAEPLPAAGPMVAAASDLKFALDEIAADFTRVSGQSVTLTYGSSGTFATQIRHGAPFELFLSADESYVQQLHTEGRTRDGGALYAIGRIVLIAAPGSALPVDPTFEGLGAFLAEGRLRRFAIANPAHAPYGRRAEEALRHAGLWDAIKPHLVLGENVSQAAQYATSGSADGGIVALSLALAPQMDRRIRYAVIPQDWHAPLRQRMVLLRRASDQAAHFYRFLQEAAARAVMVRHGFTLPDAAP